MINNMKGEHMKTAIITNNTDGEITYIQLTGRKAYRHFQEKVSEFVYEGKSFTVRYGDWEEEKERL